MSDPDQTLPPARRSSDVRLDALERDLKTNTLLTADNTEQIKAIALTVNEVKTGNDSLLEMKETIERHIGVMCTWARWFKRGAWGLLSLAGAALPVIVGLKQLGII